MQKFTSQVASLVALACIPFFTYAAIKPPENLSGLVAIITGIIGKLVVLVFALTFLAVIWGVIKGWIIHGGDAEGVESGKNVVAVGVITLTIMVSIWGILALLQAGIFG